MGDYFGAMGSAIYSKLAGGTALVAALGGSAIYSDRVPAGKARPYVVFNHMGGGPDNITPRDIRSGSWFVRAYANTNEQAKRIDGFIEALLNKGELTVSDWTVFWLVREEDLSLVEDQPNGQFIYMAGGTYRIRLSK